MSKLITKNDLKAIFDEILPWRRPTGYGTSVDITSYNSSSNMYTCPSDGVIRIQCTYRSNAYITLNNEDGEGLAQCSSTGNANMGGNLLSSTPVFTGMKVYVVNNSTYNYAHFIPYTY